MVKMPATSEYREKQRLIQTGKSRNKGIQNPFYGKIHSREQKEKWSNERRGNSNLNSLDMKAKKVQAEIAYLAGFFDGEGSIGIFKRKSKTCKRGISFELMVQLSNTEKEPTETYHRNYGGSLGNYHYQYSYTSPVKKRWWRWTVAATKAKIFLEELLPYLIVKKERAELAVLFQSRQMDMGLNHTRLSCYQSLSLPQARETGNMALAAKKEGA